jgi:hypothetical protein
VGPLKSGKGQAILLKWEIQGRTAALLEWEVQDKTSQGRVIFDRVIVAHESAEAMKYGRRKLKDIADACGVKDSITDLTVLLNKPCSIYVKVEHDDAGDFPPKNRVGRVRPLQAKTNGTNGKADFNDQVPF